MSRQAGFQPDRFGEGKLEFDLSADVPGPGYEPWLAAVPVAAAIFTVSLSGQRISRWNDAFGVHMEDLARPQSGPCPDWVTAFRKEIDRFAAGRQAISHFGIERPGALGIEYFSGSLTWLERPDVTGRGRVLLTTFDQTTERRIESNLRRELIFDALTTLPNRIGFGEEVERAIQSGTLAPTMPLMVLIVNIAGFSRINESLGAVEGDSLILTVARRLRDAVTDAVCIARIGGDEFAVCCPVANGVTDAMKLARRIKAVIAEPTRLGGYRIAIDCTVGCALAWVKEADAEELVRQALSALRTAKTTDRLEIYRAGVLKAAKRRFQIEGRLREALAQDGLHLAYQPLIDLATQTVIGFEALARWEDRDLGVVSPTEFIPVAEESGLIVPLGRWAINGALQQLAQWDQAHGGPVPVTMSVNVSPIQMTRDDVLAMVVEALHDTGIDGSRLMVELTESAVIADPENTHKLLSALKNYDVRIAMDDFGTGYSNMASLQSLPIDVLKIDRSFITNMLQDEDKMAIVEAIISLARALKQKITAEGIETLRVARALRKMNCNTGQGYYFAKPLGGEDAYQFWLSRFKRART